MTIDKLKRVMWRLEEGNASGHYKLKDVRRAIMEEIGVEERTIKRNIKILLELGYLTRDRRWDFYKTSVIL